ncbi:MAG: hypothetical protein HYT42_01900 [Candidatus Sungbacteria bacterium]|nr:hypothetical protein [Candidatus Sungbacteria bacterium]
MRRRRSEAGSQGASEASEPVTESSRLRKYRVLKMPNKTIDLRKIKNELRGIISPENYIGEPPEEELAITKEATHPETEEAQTQKLRGQDDRSAAILQWRAPEFDYHPQKSLTLFLFGALLWAGGVAALFFKNFLFAVLLAIAGGLVIHHSSRRPRELQFYISPRGIKIGRRIYQFEDLNSFWVLYDPPYSRELIIESKKTLMPVIRAPIGETNPLEIRKILLRFLKEEKHEESLADIVSKHLGF